MNIAVLCKFFFCLSIINAKWQMHDIGQICRGILQMSLEAILLQLAKRWRYTTRFKIQTLNGYKSRLVWLWDMQLARIVPWLKRNTAVYLSSKLRPYIFCYFEQFVERINPIFSWDFHARWTNIFVHDLWANVSRSANRILSKLNHSLLIIRWMWSQLEIKRKRNHCGNEEVNMQNSQVRHTGGCGNELLGPKVALFHHAYW